MTATANRLAGGILPVVLLAAALAGFLLFAGWSRSTSVDRSAIGLQGLAVWLAAQGIEARSFYGGDQLTADRVALRVYPLYDDDLRSRPPRPENRTERRLSAVERDVRARIVQSKIASLPTLIVLPKWRSGVFDLGVTHPSLLVPLKDVQRVLDQTVLAAGALRDRPAGFTDLAFGAQSVQLYGAQLLAADACEPVIGDRTAMLFGKCESDGNAVWLLSDPDLVSNHGLTRGDNAAVAAAVLGRIAAGGPIVIDMTTEEWIAPTVERRSWSDLARFFGPPFLVAWAALAMLVCLALWRAWIRARPPLPDADAPHHAASTVSIDARARLLRLSGHDAELVSGYIADKVQVLAAEVFGMHRIRADDPAGQLDRLLRRRRPDLAEALADATAAATPGSSASPADLLGRVDRFERIFTRVNDELGRHPAAGGPHPR